MSNMSKGKTMKVYGITGSIACGKSTVTHYLIERGYLVVDADLISRNALTIDQECILKVQELFGCVKDGIVDRKALGRIVFHDKNAKKQLEAIIHPYVILKMKEEIEKNKLFITNLGKCTQIDARPLPDEVLKKYLKLLFKEIDIIKPKVIITFGNQVSSIILDKKITVSQNRKIAHELEVNKNKYKVYPVYYSVGNGIFNIDKSIEDINWIIENEIKS